MRLGLNNYLCLSDDYTEFTAVSKCVDIRLEKTLQLVAFFAILYEAPTFHPFRNLRGNWYGFCALCRELMRRYFFRQR